MDLTVCLLDPVSVSVAPAEADSGESSNKKAPKRPYDIGLYALAPAVGDSPAMFLKLKVKFKSDPKTMFRLLSACFERLIGARLLGNLPTRSCPGTPSHATTSPVPAPSDATFSAPKFVESFDPALSALKVVEADVSSTASAWNSAVSRAETVLKLASSRDRSAVLQVVYDAIAIARPAVQLMTKLPASVPFASSSALAVNGMFDVFPLVTEGLSEAGRFLILAVQMLRIFAQLLNQCAEKLSEDSGWKPRGSKVLAMHLRQGFKLLYSLTKQAPPGSSEKHVHRSSDTILKLQEKSKQLQGLIAVIKMDVGLQFSFMVDLRTTLEVLRTGNEESLQTVREVCSRENAASKSSLLDIARAMDVKEDDMKACMREDFEALTAEIVQLSDRDAGVASSLIENPIFRYIWRNHCGSDDLTSRGTFVDALRSYWASKLGAVMSDKGNAEDGSRLLSEINVASLLNLVDADRSETVRCAF